LYLNKILYNQYTDFIYYLSYSVLAIMITCYCFNVYSFSNFTFLIIINNIMFKCLKKHWAKILYVIDIIFNWHMILDCLLLKNLTLWYDNLFIIFILYYQLFIPKDELDILIWKILPLNIQGMQNLVGNWKLFVWSLDIEWFELNYWWVNALHRRFDLLSTNLKSCEIWVWLH
jgi:hypothetical protein